MPRHSPQRGTPEADTSVHGHRGRHSDENARLEEVAPGVHVWRQPDGTWWLNNAGAVLGKDGAVLIDTCATAERTRAFLAAVEAASDRAAVIAAVSTHAHGDHTHGNALLPASVPVIAHPETRRTIEREKDTVLTGLPPIWSPAPSFGITEYRLPDVVTDGPLTLYTGDRRIELQHPGHPAHTAGDLVAWLPEERVLFAGDLLFHTITPLVLGGSVEGSLRALDWLAEFGAETIVPGHGPLISRDDLDGVLDDHARYYRFVRQLVHDSRSRGLTPLDAARGCDLGEFADWPEPERIVLNLHSAYCTAEGTTIDPIAAFTDAVTFRGGPLHCAL